jgi:hypothetical protein
MGKHKGHGRDEKEARREAKRAAAQAGDASAEPSADGSSGQGQHHAAAAHGQPPVVDASLPATRTELLALHAAARKRRNGSELGSEAYQAAVTDLERIEVRVAAIERAQDPQPG